MIIEELDANTPEPIKLDDHRWVERGSVVIVKGGGEAASGDAKRILVGAGARFLFYPTLLYNVLRNKLQPEFRWWDPIGKFIILGAVPFPTDVPRLKSLGVRGVITLNEPYETLVPSSLYRTFDINHLVLPTRDYCFAPSLTDISRAVDFIHGHALRGEKVYVHCKAGRGRSTTVVLCYLIQHHMMTPKSAYEYVKSIRPRILLASAQRLAVENYYNLMVKSEYDSGVILRDFFPSFAKNSVLFDDGSVVFVEKSDVDGYDNRLISCGVENEVWVDLRVVYRVGVAIGRISCFWKSSKSNAGQTGRLDLEICVH